MRGIRGRFRTSFAVLVAVCAGLAAAPAEAATHRFASAVRIADASVGTVANVHGVVEADKRACRKRVVKIYDAADDTRLARTTSDGRGAWIASVGFAGGERIYAAVPRVVVQAGSDQVVCRASRSDEFEVPAPVGRALDVAKAGSGDGSWSCNGTACQPTYEDGAQVTVAAAPAAGSTFGGWSGHCSGAGDCVLTMNADKLITATFDLEGETFALNVTKSGDGDGSWSCDGVACQPSYPAAAQVTLTAAPAARSTFTGWSGDCSGDGPCELSMDADKNVGASFDAPDPVQPQDWQPSVGSVPNGGTYLYLESDVGDWIGQGSEYLYTLSDALIDVSTAGRRVDLGIEGDENWGGTFELPDRFSSVETGEYLDVTRYPFHDKAVGGLDFGGEGRGCNTLTGWFVVDEVGFETGGQLDHITLRFEQHCEGQTPSLRGKLVFDNDDVPTYPDPGQAPSWQPPMGAVPAEGTYLYLESDGGDYIGQGSDYLYTLDNAVITTTAIDRRVSLSIDGDEWWSGTFALPDRYTAAQEGYFPDVHRYPFHNPVKGGLSFSGEGRGCNELEGWFSIDQLGRETDGSLDNVTLRFEQFCDGDTAALRGKLRFDNDDVPTYTGPGDPPDWQPPTDAVPAEGTFVYLDSDVGDYIGQGRDYLYTQSDAVIAASTNGRRLDVSVNGDESWSATFALPDRYSAVEEGYFPDVNRYPFHNPVKGGLSFSGEGRGCNELEGWFSIDQLGRETNGSLDNVTVRFEQFCEGGTAALRGKVRFDNDDVPVFPDPGPAPDWQPPSEAVPADASFVYLDSDTGDWVGGGVDRLYTLSDSLITATASGRRITLSIDGDEWWNARFELPDRYSSVVTGYFPDVQRYPFHNPRKGGLDFSGDGRGCNKLTGWFAVDDVGFELSGALDRITLRFEQHCEGGPAALRGKLRFDNDEIPVYPDPGPAPEWQPPAGAVPSSGTYLYFDSDTGDYIGQGQERLYQAGTATISSATTGGRLWFSVDQGSDWWDGNLQLPDRYDSVEVGYFPDVQRYPFHNRVKGGLDFSGNHRGCNELNGWFTVDDVGFDIDGSLDHATVRFEQHCENGTPALRGKFVYDED